MLKLLAVLRTLFLIFVIGYTVRAMTWTFDLPTDSAEAYNLCRTGLSGLRKAAWIAIGWIAFETAIGWWLAARVARAKLPADVPKGGEPPFAPPGHR
jgi:hypothetical protein